MECHQLEKIKTRQHLMDVLEDMILPPKSEDENASAGRLRELKSYMIESDDGLPDRFEASGLLCSVRNTGIDEIKILNVREDRDAYEFYLDKHDPRFFILHTNVKSDDAHRIVEKMTRDVNHALDHAWFHSGMLERVVGMQGNEFRGFGVSYSDRKLISEEEDDAGVEDLNLSISGSMAVEMKKMIQEHPDIGRTCAYKMVRVMRGSASSVHDYAQDEVHSNGHFSLKRGKSVVDHLNLLKMCHEAYSETMESVERLRIGTKRVGGKTLFDGRPFDFKFGHDVENLELFIAKMFSSTAPFNLWGIRSKVNDGYFRVMAIDLHTGSPLNFEIASDMMRVYLGKGNCGNTILRLLTNLQMHHDAKDACLQVA